MSQPKFLYWFNPNKQRNLIGRGRFFVALGFGFAVLNLLLIPILGINWGIDFAGGTEMQVKFEQVVKAEQIRSVLEEQGFEKNQVQQYGADKDNEWLVRIERLTTLTDARITELKGVFETGLGVPVRIDFHAHEGDRFFVIVDAPKDDGDALAMSRALDAQQSKLGEAVEGAGQLRLRRTRAHDGAPETTADAIVRDEPYQGNVKYLVQLQGVSDKVGKALTEKLGKLEVRRVDFVDATVAEGLKTDGLLALIVSMVLIAVYVAVRFDIYFAPGALIALMHDPIGALCVYTIGRMDFDLPSVAAMLTIIGYSIDNTIVIYDRVRETMPVSTTALSYEQVKEVVNKAVNDTLNRTVNSVTATLLTSVSLWVFTEGAVRTFAACLSVGILIGAYSSILMAPPIYLFFRKTFFNPGAPVDTTGPTKEERERGIV
jgi:preprotein translocase subunit SecF